jgi:glycosyltransferase involved in cell wall biosynthesis
LADLRVLVDARWVSLAPESSHARYLRALTAEWVELDRAPFLTLVGPGPRPVDLATGERVTWCAAPDLPGHFGRRPGSRLWSNTVFTAVSAAKHPDVLFFPWSVLPKLLGAPAVVMVHDVCFRTNPERFPDGGRGGDALLEAAVRSATEVLTPSAASKRGVVAAYALDERRVTVVRHGIAPIFSASPMADDAEALRKFGIEPPYVLCVSTHEPRKNLDVLVRAFVQHIQRQQQAQAYPSLVLVGRRSDATARLVEALSTSPVAAEHTHFVDGLTDAELASLYRQAAAAMLPSVCEGFGFPLLEAIACGTPVVASDLVVFRELVDNAAVYAPWHDVDAWAAAIQRVVTETDLKLRAREAAARVRRQFAWRTSASETLRALERAAETGSGRRSRAWSWSRSRG